MWEQLGASPLPPKNLQVLSPYVHGVLDLRWDPPQILTRNTPFTIVGVNVYRSEGSDLGPYIRLNEYPLGGNFYRDYTDLTQVYQETVQWESSWDFRGDASNDRRWVFRTRQPISKRNVLAPNQGPTYGRDPSDVVVRVNGEVVPAHGVRGATGEVTLINAPLYDPIREVWDPPILPRGPEDVVDVSYFTPSNFVRSGLDTHVWYRVTSVALDSSSSSGYSETPLEWCEPKSALEVESMDYIWREAVRRNAWILQQGGERVKFFVRKTAGVPCDCGLDPRTREYMSQPRGNCPTCFGTGFLLGYEGPYDGIIGPDDAERKITQGVTGRYMEHVYEVWTGPSPLLTQRDFLVKQTNERYSLGPVRRPSHRGNLLQQHFNIQYLDQGDIRYRVPVDGTDQLGWPQTRGPELPSTYTPRPVDGALGTNPQWPLVRDAGFPTTTDKVNIPDEIERRGRTRVWENTEY